MSVTHPGYSSVWDETCCEAPNKPPHLQRTHVGTACKQHSWCQHQLGYTKIKSEETYLKCTHESSLAFLLHEEQLSPVSGSCLHPKHHQVAQRQHPQEGGEEEFS